MDVPFRILSTATLREIPIHLISISEFVLGLCYMWRNIPAGGYGDENDALW